MTPTTSNDCNDSAPASFAAAPGSAAPDCCAAWTRSGERAAEFVAIRWGMTDLESEMKLQFCPWCGRARPNDQAHLQPPGGNGGAQNK